MEWKNVENVEEWMQTSEGRATISVECLLIGLSMRLQACEH